jgi:hypothetical protein
MTETATLTPSCAKLYAVIMKVSRMVSNETAAELQNAFCEFDCAWAEHAEEWHGDDPPKVKHV